MLARLRACWAYLRTPIVMTRGNVIGSVALLGALASIALIVSWSASRGLAHEKAAQAHVRRTQLRRDLEAKIERARREAAVARRLARLERPSVRRLLAALREAERSPRATREVQQELRKLIASTAPAAATPTGRPVRPAPRPSGPARGQREPPPAATAPPAATTPPASPAPPPAPPVVVVPPPPVVTTPLGPVGPVTVCLPPLAAIGSC